ncbi:MAG: glucose-6-phosphate dehydrogenase, partial [Burkholderiales bacterium]
VPVDAPPAPPCTLVIFGASGDLTRRLLVPAFHNLSHDQVLDASFDIVGVDRVQQNDEEFRTYLSGTLQALAADDGGEFQASEIDETSWGWLAERLHYATGDFDDPDTYRRIGSHLDLRAKVTGAANAVFYLAVAPRFFGPIVDHLAATGLVGAQGHGFRRIVIEKPFGSDLASARALNARVLRVVDESQLYRIDHFLGKETVQNIMALRFANGMFEPIWNREHIDHVQITAAETVGVEHRGRFYDATGALRDMVPNHMFQLLAMTAMEAPNSFSADAIRTEKAKAIDAIRLLTPQEAAMNTVRGQYDAGIVSGTRVNPYRREPDVASDSGTETYVALKLMIDNWRWSGVPFYIRTGKAMAVRRTDIAIQFKRAPAVLFRNTPTGDLDPNLMVLRIQPDEGVSLRFAAKVPGRTVRLSEVNMDFRYADYFQAEPSTGYETLIYDCLIGDPTLFQRADNIEAGWTAVQPVLDGWAAANGRLELYKA